MISRAPRAVLALGLVLAVSASSFACTSDDADDLPVADAERARELAFLTPPRSRTLDREAYLSQQDAEGASLTDAQVAFARAVWGRLGFFPADFDVRSVSGARSENVAAFYSPRDKLITLFEDSRPATVVHELVHALQDQHFDFLAYADVPTLDEGLARRAVAEGDAELCEARFEIWRDGGDPLAVIPRALTAEATEASSARFFAAIELPPFFAADVGFVYPFGRAFVGRRIGLLDTPAAWDRARDDALFRAEPPRSSEEVLRTALGLPLDALETVTLDALPPGVADRFDLGDDDRLGAWYVRVLFSSELVIAQTLGLGWDGDRITVLVAKGAPEDAPPAGVVWTALWDDESVATVALGALASLQRTGDPLGSVATSTFPDGDAVHVERRGRLTTVVRGRLSADDLRAVADRALGPVPARPLTPSVAPAPAPGPAPAASATRPRSGHRIQLPPRLPLR